MGVFELKSKHVILPYIIGIAWIICHPIISIVTGEAKCRGIYMDEHQLDLHGFHTDAYSLEQIRRDVKEVHRLGRGMMDYSNACNVLDTVRTQYDRFEKEYKEKVKNAKLKSGQQVDEEEEEEKDKELNPYLTPYISCHSLGEKEGEEYSLVKINPSLAPTTPVESLVLVIPYASNWFKSDFHLSILTFIERMVKSPWLAKRVLIVYPHSNSTSMDQVVTRFLEDSASVALPRQLVVLDVEASTAYKSDQFVILTQGEKGVVPNLDLVAAVRLSLQQNFGKQVPMIMHPFDLNWWKVIVNDRLPIGSVWQEWGVDFGEMVAFMAAFWRSSPHAAALGRGIDSVTIQAQLRPNRDSRFVHQSVVHTVASVEHLFRGLNSLSERLHHNVNQYLLPSSNKFVSHGEYIIPAILLVLPLALRVIKLVMHDLESFQFYRGFSSAAGAMSIAAALVYCYTATDCIDTIQTVALIMYLVTLLVVFFKPKFTDRTASQRSNEQRSIQLIACMLALYAHVPIAVSHVSLFIISTLVWVPLLSFVDYGGNTKLKMIPGMLMLAIFILMLLVVFVATGIDDLSIPWGLYVCSIVIPMHFLVVILSLG